MMPWPMDASARPTLQMRRTATESLSPAAFRFFRGSAVGDVAWPGIALAQLYARTGVKTYLDGAVKAATFIETNHTRQRECSAGRLLFR